MRAFVLVSLVYALAAALAAALLAGEPLVAARVAVNGSLAAAHALSLAAPGVIAAAVAGLAFCTVAVVNGRGRQVLLAAVGTLALQIGFSTFKNLIPVLVPYYADPALAAADRALHFGQDPWVATHRLAALLPMEWLIGAYLQVWVIPAMFLPVIAVASDRDAGRVRRLLVCYMAVWLGLGHLAALGGSSVGPVFYDRLLGTDRFAGLGAAIASSPLQGSVVGDLYDYLWTRYQSGNLIFGMGISAFPSVHVAIAALTALYLGERHRWLGVAGWIFLALILFLSVYTGLHYALDGYASILAVVAGWRVLKWLDRRRSA